MDAAVKPIADPAAVTEFVVRWKGNAGSERANFQSFMRDLCGLLDLPLPDPGKGENAHNAYVYELRIPANVTGHYGDRDRSAHRSLAGSGFVS
ncbi:hypothetical protein [Halomonas salipaludis]|uniref:hypothetical protein n=1 Tax=Halomonas salipaludis TaxID=2032625 RepID=UPI0015959E95|nr:hypothetical protein [Halomonas salipaludis]